MVLALILGTIGAHSVSNLLIKNYQVRVGIKKFHLAFMNVVLSGVVFIGMIAMKGFALHYALLPLLMAAVYGLMFWFYNIIKVNAAGCGPMAILSLFYVTGGVSFPTLYGLIFLREPVIFHKILGIILIFVSFVPLILESRHKLVFSGKFWVLCVVLLVFNGLLVVISKVAQQHSLPEYSMDFVALYYFFYLLASIAQLVTCLHKPDMEEVAQTLTVPNFLVAACAGVFNALGTGLNFMLAFHLPASIQFPMVQSSILVVVTVSSLILYREKPSKGTILSLVLTIASIILLSV